MTKKTCYGGTQFEASGKVVDLQQQGSKVKFRLKPALVNGAAMSNGNATAMATVLICRKLTKTCNGMENNNEVFLANRKWWYVYDAGSLIKNGDMVRIFIARNEIDKVRDLQMKESVEVPLSGVIKN